MIRNTFLGLVTGVFLSFGGAALADITYEGGDGTTVETAVIITGAEGSPDGVQSEYVWIEKNHPGAEVLGQALVQNGDKFYDVITIRKGGKDTEIYFDITGFFGKF
jgi:hypothetical protein